MSWKIVEAITGVFTAIGTVLVAILAIWGDYFRYKFAGPQIELSLNDPRGDLTLRSNQTHTYFFHLKVHNRRQWSPAKDVRVLLDRIAKRAPDGSFVLEPLVYPLPLAWTPGEIKDFQRTVADTETCDLGFLDEKADNFRLSTLITPNNFKGYVRAGAALRARIVASGRDATSSKPLFLEIAWDGRWTVDRDEMKKHLVVKEVKAL
jgi:hypothetical protein